MTERNEPCWCGSGKKYKKCHLSIDEQNRTKGSGALPKPPRLKKGLIKSPEQIEIMRRCGRFNGELLDYIKPFIKQGAVTEDLDRMIREYTVSHGHKSACLGYKGYPKSCCISRNDVVCHGIPSSKEILEEGDIVNIDLTTIIDGFYGDSSETFFIGEVSKEARHLVETAAQALIIGIDAVKPGLPLGVIGEAVEPYVNSRGCSVVRQYTGHGIGAKFHEFFSVYHHVESDGEKIVMLPGMTFTIEPMINLGGWEVDTDSRDKWTVRTKDGSLSAQFEHTVLVTETGAEILTLTPSQRAAGVRLLPWESK
ncbi:MAG: type I methionyl aminopeptidase [Chitinispirillales bacterium]|jgi:methionyl aminopeptidase|nr:type I methionyl aminopeptidase [Chitinispirillales bacterium]